MTELIIMFNAFARDNSQKSRLELLTKSEKNKAIRVKKHCKKAC